MRIYYTVLVYDDGENEVVASKKRTEVSNRLIDEGHKVGYNKFIEFKDVKDTVNAFITGFNVSEGGD